ncbi:translocon-associated protein subunit alpha-like [Corticium candelabrum]|uniref:translocon-associated protein subunit alpha-like n=1 Tax=Corticium candelabrum TaxID=121492 RepID=UPI002E262E42|nr:translocon-associated protein subunit alpha-like [Corticium candelabrum]
MSRLLFRLFLVFLVVVPSSILLARRDGSQILAEAAEDPVENEEEVADSKDEEEDEEETTVEDESDGEESDEGEETEKVGDVADSEEEEGEEKEEKIASSPDVETSILFTTGSDKDLPAGGTVKIIVGFQNNGTGNFVIENIDASFRYPQDFSYFIQNFTTRYYDTLVEPQYETCLAYEFMPSETFGSRSFGFTVLVNYKDTEGTEFQDAVFNETINIYEQEEGIDAETFFLYVLLMAGIAVVGLVIYNYLPTSTKKKPQPTKPVEMGTQANADVDQSWLPMDHLKPHSISNNTSPRVRRSPRNKKPKS